MSNDDDARHGPMRAAGAATGEAAAKTADAGKFGPTLRAARESADLSIADMARALKVEQQIVEALEAERYEDLPPRPYIRGYVQRYARLVGLDAAALTAGLNTVEESETVSPTVVPRSRWAFFNDFARERWGVIYGSIVLVFILVVGGALWWAWPGVTAKPVESELDETPGPSVPDVPFVADRAADPAPALPELPDVAVPDAAAEAPTPAPPAAVSESSDGAASDVAAQELTPASPEPSDGGAPGSATGGPDPLSPAASVMGDGDADPNAEAAVDAEPAVKPDLLSIVFQEDSWVEVRERDGDLIHGDLGRGGDTVTLTGEAPFEILVGYADGVEITFNGDPVSLEPGTRGDVARLVVGH